MTIRERRLTATDRIRLVLADEIVLGSIGPGVALDEVSLAERFKVSRTPVREAIRQLEAIGFVEARPHRGAVVPHFTKEKIDEMFVVMADLEALCARNAAASIEPAMKQQLMDAHLACKQAALEGDIDEYYRRNIAFHEVIYIASGNGFLAEITLNVRNRVAPFRKAQFQSFNRLMNSVAEHETIVNHILSGEAEAAAEAMTQHLRVVRDSVGTVAPTLR
ncbi:GntR family transcriptional regulator [Rhizobium sp. NTR19]|uniref:GntR family transcriptional regulator n=1 Tax=Neorhizobium turbinariae TaxID=2937795 RepID=A0ABT0ISA8_9HYPH|nr:GntR family transcriptional regulator [Neorhizobium turbinariae]MCK8780767.1 GntR family transcriptional regulator [Neorhizobium turbinariae]